MNVLIKTNHGDMVVELNSEKAPDTVENFLRYVRDGFYDGTIFHRVIDGFMIQGGGFASDMRQKKTHGPIKNEAADAPSNEFCTIAMARTSDPHSATAQFFINASDNTFLDYKAPTPDGWGYCVFGKVIQGQDVVKKINTVDTSSRAGHQDVPVEDVTLEKAVVLEE